MRKAEAPARWWAEVEMQVQRFDLDPMHTAWHRPRSGSDCCCIRTVPDRSSEQINVSLC